MDLRYYIHAAIDKAIAERKDNIALGAHTWEQYLRGTGYIGGLLLAKEIMEETYREFIKE